MSEGLVLVKGLLQAYRVGLRCLRPGLWIGFGRSVNCDESFCVYFFGGLLCLRWPSHNEIRSNITRVQVICDFKFKHLSELSLMVFELKLKA